MGYWEACGEVDSCDFDTKYELDTDIIYRQPTHRRL